MGSGSSVKLDEATMTKDLLLKVSSCPTSQLSDGIRTMTIGRIMAASYQTMVSFISEEACVHCEVTIRLKNATTNEPEVICSQRVTQDFFLSDGESNGYPVYFPANAFPVTFFGTAERGKNVDASNREAVKRIFQMSGKVFEQYPESDLSFIEVVFALGEQICVVGKVEKFESNGQYCLKMNPTSSGDYNSQWYSAYNFSAEDQERWKKLIGAEKRYLGSNNTRYMPNHVIPMLSSVKPPSDIAPPRAMAAPISAKAVVMVQPVVVPHQQASPQQMPVVVPQQQPMMVYGQQQPQYAQQQQPMYGQQQPMYAQQQQPMYGQQPMYAQQQQPMYGQQQPQYAPQQPMYGQQPMYRQQQMHEQQQPLYAQQQPVYAQQQQPTYAQQQPVYGQSAQSSQPAYGGNTSGKTNKEPGMGGVVAAGAAGAVVGAGAVGLATYGPPDMGGVGATIGSGASAAGGAIGGGVGAVGSAAAPVIGAVGSAAAPVVGAAGGAIGFVAGNVGEVGTVTGSAVENIGGSILDAIGSIF